MEKVTSILIALLICGIVAVGAALVLEKPAEQPVTSAIAPSATIIPVGTQAPSGTPAPATSSCQPLTITQTDGMTVSLPCEPQRIIAANANAAELLIAMGAGDRIVGVTESTKSVPYVMDKIPNAVSIGDWQNPNIERMLALNPDIVIAYSSSKPKNFDQITAANITIISLDCFKLSTLSSDARALGRLTGKMNEAEVYARLVEDTISDVTGRLKKIPSGTYPEVYFEMYTDYTVAAAGSGAHELVTGAGGKNIADDVSSSSVKVSPEWVVARQPEYILKVVSSTNTISLEEMVGSLKTRPGWEMIPAVKNDHVHAMKNEIVYGPRAYIGLVYTAQLLHPSEFRDLHPRQMLTDYDERYVAGTNKTGLIWP
ncbi:MAG: ABC transporter substrate-binding protein [Methanoregula sp.]|jgi:iron complex transport system substrate-binding protein|nr:ABC transporter substrate-binding protein [Methanoregula sp.]